nr:MAG TPA: hypothetical protein [Caudoviricetes sp.]
MSIVRGDTFTVSIDVYGDRFLNALGEEKNVLVTFQQNEVSITKYGKELEFKILTEEGFNNSDPDHPMSWAKTVGANVRCHLSAEETMRFQVGGVQVQIKWGDENGNKCSAKVVQIPVGGSLREAPPRTKEDKICLM